MESLITAEHGHVLNTFIYFVILKLEELGGATHRFCSAFLFYNTTAAVVLNVFMEIVCVYTLICTISHLD